MLYDDDLDGGGFAALLLRIPSCMLTLALKSFYLARNQVQVQQLLIALKGCVQLTRLKL